MATVIFNPERTMTDQFTAGAAVTGRLAVKPDSTAGTVIQGTANARCLGVASASAASGGAVEVITSGLAVAKAGGTWAVGDLLKSDSSGQLVAVSSSLGSDDQAVVAVAAEAASSGDYKRVIVAPGGSVSLDKLLKVDLASTANGKGASLVGVEDAAANYTAADVEAVLAEIATSLGGKYATTAKQDFVVEFDRDRYLGTAFWTDIIASETGLLAFVAHRALDIEGVVLSLEETGADASNPLELAADVKIGGTTCLTTQPKITKAAADGANTAAAGTGITQAVVDSGANTAAAGARVTVDLNLTRTAAPTDEMGGVRVIVICSYTLPY